MTSTPSQPQPGFAAQPHRGSDPTTAIPVQRAGSPVPTPAPPAPKARGRWPFAVGGLVVGLVIGASVHGGSTTPTPTPTPSAAPPALTGPLTSFTNGTYEVGTDIAVGKHKTPGPGSTDIMDSCCEEVGDGSGSLTGISQNDNLTGPGVVTLEKGKVFKAAGGCTWTKVG